MESIEVGDTVFWKRVSSSKSWLQVDKLYPCLKAEDFSFRSKVFHVKRFIMGWGK